MNAKELTAAQQALVDLFGKVFEGRPGSPKSEAAKKSGVGYLFVSRVCAGVAPVYVQGDVVLLAHADNRYSRLADVLEMDLKSLIEVALIVQHEAGYCEGMVLPPLAERWWSASEKAVRADDLLASHAQVLEVFVRQCVPLLTIANLPTLFDVHERLRLALPTVDSRVRAYRLLRNVVAGAQDISTRDSYCLARMLDLFCAEVES